MERDGTSSHFNRHRDTGWEGRFVFFCSSSLLINQSFQDQPQKPLIILATSTPTHKTKPRGPTLPLLSTMTAATRHASPPNQCSIVTPRFPPELISQFLEEAIHKESYRTRKSILCSASLVCRSWGQLAKVLLWRKVVFGEDGAGELRSSILDSPALGRYRTRQVSVQGWWENSFSAEVIANLVGIEDLRLAYFGATSGQKLDLSILSSPNLKGAGKVLIFLFILG